MDWMEAAAFLDISPKLQQPFQINGFTKATSEPN
ncbi:hypothetical protein MTsPCn3_05480 [Erythrobacter sp. MTPC3]